MEYKFSAVVKTKYSNEDAFANSLLLQYGKGKVKFADNSLIPETAINEIKQVMNQFTGEIAWQPGDLVMIDNSRFLHGRRAFQDSRRQIFSTLSWLNF